MRLDALALPALAPQRERVLDALAALSADPEAAARVLKLTAGQRGEIEVNARVRSSPTMPAVDRYTGVLYDALDAASLDTAARRWLGSHVLIHTAPLGPVGALDRIPAYRMGAGASLPGVGSAKAVWSRAVSDALADAAPRFVLDLRSEAYAALGPVPASAPTVYVRVVSDSGGSAVRALNHFNKHAKGALVRALAHDRPRFASVEGLRHWAAARGLRLGEGVPGEVMLFA